VTAVALPDLIARLEADAASEVRAIEADADEAVRAIEAAAGLTIAEATSRHLGTQQQARRLAFQRELSSARRQARARELHARHAQLERILSRARALIPEIAASSEYQRALPVHLDEALAYLERLPSLVRCPATSADVLRPIVARHAGIELVVDDTVGAGVIAESIDGSVSVDNTLAARLARIADRLTVDLAREASRG
jgi:vacuolar-type H+-ATPase subunit E/Vma4